MILKSILSPNIKLVSFDEEFGNIFLQKKYLKWLNDSEIVRSIGSPELLKHKNISFIHESFKRFTRKHSMGFFIQYNGNKEFIGTCKLDQIDMVNKFAWDGIMIGEKSYHGKKISLEVYKILLEYAFNNLKLEVIYGGCSSFNIPMTKTFKKIGYEHTKTEKEVDYINEKFYDHYYFKITKEQFLKFYKK